MNSAASRQVYGACNRFSPERNLEEALDDSKSANGPANRSLLGLLRKQATILVDWTINAELELLLAQQAAITDRRGRPACVRNGYQPVRSLLTNLGPVEVRIPKVRSRVERSVVFRSALVRPYLRRARVTIQKAPAHFLRALSVGDLHAAIGTLMGPEAAALPAPVIRRLSERWEGEHKRWLTGSLAPLKRASLWLDSVEGGDAPPHGIGSVMLAVAIDEAAREQILAVVHGTNETKKSWTQLLRNLRERGMPPPLHVHHGGKPACAMAAAAAAVYPEAELNPLTTVWGLR